jgi:hypothetical protein
LVKPGKGNSSHCFYGSVVEIKIKHKKSEEEYTMTRLPEVEGRVKLFPAHGVNVIFDR